MNTPSTLLSNGRYRLVERLAVGGMGEVWRAEDQLLGRDVAIKILKDEYADDETFRTRFRAEARNTAGLSHPGIAQMYDYGEQDDLAYLVMELVPGQPLSEILARNERLSAEVTLDLVAQTSRALQAAHDAGLIHRDIKPGNLIVDPDGAVKVTDFGIARVVDSATLTQTGTVLGTAQYVSPEQAEGRPLTGATDIYSLGIVAYECLSGHTPFTGESAVAIALSQVRDEPPPLPDDVPSGVRELVARCLAKSPERRPASAGELSNVAYMAVEALRAGDPEAGQEAISQQWSGRSQEDGGVGPDLPPGLAENAEALDTAWFAAEAAESEAEGQGPDATREVVDWENPTTRADSVASEGAGHESRTGSDTPAFAAPDPGPDGSEAQQATQPSHRRRILVMAGAMVVALVCAGGLVVGFGWQTWFRPASVAQKADPNGNGDRPAGSAPPSSHLDHLDGPGQVPPDYSRGGWDSSTSGESRSRTSSGGSSSDDESSGSSGDDGSNEAPTPGSGESSADGSEPTEETPTTPGDDSTGGGGNVEHSTPPPEETTPPAETTPPTETTPPDETASPPDDGQTTSPPSND